MPKIVLDKKVIMATHVTPAIKEKFYAKCRAVGLNPSERLRALVASEIAEDVK